jgi:hypothetical protein
MTSAFRALLLEGVRRFGESGYDELALSEWLGRLQTMLERELPTDEESREMLTRILGSVYQRDVRGGLAKRIPGIDRYTLDRIAPHLRAELDRRIFAGVDLIRLNRKAAVEKTLQRFAGWVSSVPPTGLSENLRDIVAHIEKPARQVKFEARRVAIDQGHKLSAAVAHVVAEQNGAIAAIWHDRGEKDRSYDARPEHLKRSGSLFFIRDSWAMNEGLVKRGGPYTDDIEQPAELVYCSCYWQYVTSPHDLPEDALTARGRLWVRSSA